jgi:hypothetical protein
VGPPSRKGVFFCAADNSLTDAEANRAAPTSDFFIKRRLDTKFLLLIIFTFSFTAITIRIWKQNERKLLIHILIQNSVEFTKNLLLLVSPSPSQDPTKVRIERLLQTPANLYQ